MLNGAYRINSLLSTITKSIYFCKQIKEVNSEERLNMTATSNENDEIRCCFRYDKSVELKMPKRKHENCKSESPVVAAKKTKTENTAGEEEEKKNLTTVKCALKKRCLNEILFQRIQDDVAELSALAVEASRYAHFDLMRKWRDGNFPRNEIDFRQYFLALLRQNRDTLDPEYAALRGNLPFYDNSYRINMMNHLITQYKTAFKNNLKVHAYSRLRKFFKTFIIVNQRGESVPFEYKVIKDTLEFVFYRETNVVPNQTLLELLRNYLGWNGQKLFDIDSNKYYKHVELFYRLQRYNEQHRFKNFKIIPQFSYGSLHIRYDTQAMSELLKHLKLIEPSAELKKQQKEINKEIREFNKKLPKEQKHLEKKIDDKWFRNYIQNNEHARRMMWSFFKLPETVNRKFDFSIQTDGVAVSFSMVKNNSKSTGLNRDGNINILFFFYFQCTYQL